MNKTLFTILVVASIIGVAHSACDTTTANSCTGNGGTCTTNTCSACTTAGYVLADTLGTGSNGGCKPTCDSTCGTCGTVAVGATAAVCSVCASGTNVAGVNFAADGCSATACHSSCSSANGGTCSAGTCSGCTTTGYVVATRGGKANDGCKTCDVSCSTNGGTCANGVCSGCKVGAFKVGTVVSSNDGCVAYATANPSTNNPGSLFNVTPIAVFAATEYTSPSAFAYASNTLTYTGGFDDQNYYVWSQITSGTTYAYNRRTLQSNFTKGNSSTDVAITTTFTSTATTCSGAGYLGVVTQTPNYFGSTVSTSLWAATEIYFQSIAVNGTAFGSAKALTGNTNKNLYIDVQQCWFDKAGGVFYVTWVQSTRVQGTNYAAASGSTAAVSATAETWTLNGLYIQGVFPNGTLFYTNSTTGVQAIALTASNTGTCNAGAVACTTVATTSGATYNNAQKPSVGYQFGRQNYTNTNGTAVTFLMRDNSALDGLYSYKLGSIALGTGAGTVIGTLVTYANPTVAYAAATAQAPSVDTGYSVAGFVGSASTYGAFLLKTVKTTTVPQAGSTAETSTTVYTVLPYYNGSATLSTVGVPAIASGYGMTAIMGYGTSDGFILFERQESTAAGSTTSPYFPNSDLIQAERFYFNGTLVTATAVGTFMDQVQSFQDTNGSIIIGYTSDDYANNYLNYMGYMGKYLQQNLADASSLSSILGLLSLLIVALFGF